MQHLNIEAERVKKKIKSKKAAAQIFKVSYPTYNSWVRGGDIPSSKLVEMADYYGCTTDHLLELFDIPP